MKNKWLLLCVLLAPLAQADERPAPIGSDTRAWLQLQSSGQAAGSELRGLPGEVADKVYQRYVDSFAHPIPVTFPRDSFVGESGGGSQ
jgi:hypothetical protein